MTPTLALSVHSISDVVLIDVGEFHFTSAPFACHSIRSNQISKEEIQAIQHESEAVDESLTFSESVLSRPKGFYVCLQ